MKEEFTNQETEMNIDAQLEENIQKYVDSKKDSVGKKVIKEIFSWVKIIVIAVVVAFFINNFLIINANVPTGSMKNLILPGDRMVGLRTSYWFSNPERGDIVIFRFPDNPEEIYVKRLIGMPGETVTIKDGKVYIDDSTEPLKEDYLPEEWTIKNGTVEQGGTLIYKVPEGEYFMLGDNRNVSADSRYWNDSFVSRDQVIAKAAFKYWPFNDVKLLKSAEY